MRYHWYLVGRLQLVLALSRYVASLPYCIVKIDIHAAPTHTCTHLHPISSSRLFLHCAERCIFYCFYCLPFFLSA